MNDQEKKIDLAAELRLLRLDIKRMSNLLESINEELTKDKDIESEDELTQEEILRLRDKYGATYFTEIDGEEFLFRPLSRGEYEKATTTFNNDAAAEEYICSRATILPKDYDFENCQAGIPSILARQIIFESGFDESNPKAQDYLLQFREEMNSIENQIPCVIKEAFQDISFEEIENWGLEKTLKYYARAEYILNVLQNRDIQFISEEEQSKQQKKEFVDKEVLQGEAFDSHSRSIKAFLEGKLEDDETII